MNDIFDKEGKSLLIGDTVRLLNVTSELLQGLPDIDQLSIKAQVGSTMVIQSIDDMGNVELEFSDPSGDTHFIWVSTKDICKM